MTYKSRESFSGLISSVMFDVIVSQQATCSTNLASLNQTGTASSKASTPSAALPGDVSSVVRVWLSRASPNERLVVQVQV